MVVGTALAEWELDFSKTAARLGSFEADLIKAASDVHLDDALGWVGLERKPSSWSQILPALGLITVSAAVGAAVALLLAPSSGRKLRARLSDGLAHASHRLSDSINHIESNKNHRHAVS
jgi:hypothetical protein